MEDGIGRKGNKEGKKKEERARVGDYRLWRRLVYGSADAHHLFERTVVLLNVYSPLVATLEHRSWNGIATTIPSRTCEKYLLSLSLSPFISPFSFTRSCVRNTFRTFLSFPRNESYIPRGNNNIIILGIRAERETPLEKRARTIENSFSSASL